MVKGGPASLNGVIAEDRILNLLTPGQLQATLAVQGEARVALLTYHLMTRLNSMAKPTNEPMPTNLIQSGASTLDEYVLSDESSPFPVGSPAGLPADEVS